MKCPYCKKAELTPEHMGTGGVGTCINTPTVDEKCQICGVGRRNHIDPNPIEDIGHTFQPTPSNVEGKFYFDGITYIFEREADGNSRMICEVRGIGDGKFEENAEMLVKALNAQGQSAERAKWEKLKDWLKDEAIIGLPHLVLEKMSELEKEPK